MKKTKRNRVQRLEAEIERRTHMFDEYGFRGAIGKLVDQAADVMTRDEMLHTLSRFELDVRDAVRRRENDERFFDELQRESKLR
jgi:hypothetical protein